VWDAFVDEHGLPETCRFVGEGHLFPTHSRRPGPGHGKGQAQGQDKGQGKGYGKPAMAMGQGKGGHFPPEPNRETAALLGREEEVRAMAQQAGVDGTMWAGHVQHHYHGDAAMAHMDHLFMPLAQRDQNLDASRNLFLLDEFLGRRQDWEAHAALVPAGQAGPAAGPPAPPAPPAPGPQPLAAQGPGAAGAWLPAWGKGPWLLGPAAAGPWAAGPVPTMVPAPAMVSVPAMVPAAAGPTAGPTAGPAAAGPAAAMVPAAATVPAAAGPTAGLAAGPATHPWMAMVAAAATVPVAAGPTATGPQALPVQGPSAAAMGHSPAAIGFGQGLVGATPAYSDQQSWAYQQRLQLIAAMGPGGASGSGATAPGAAEAPGTAEARQRWQAHHNKMQRPGPGP